MDVVNPFIKSNKARMVEFLDQLSVSRTLNASNSKTIRLVGIENLTSGPKVIKPFHELSNLDVT